MLRRVLPFLLLLVALALPGLAAAQNGAGGGERLNVGDVVQVILPGEDGFAEPFTIDREGRLTLPEVGAIDVSGLSLPQARERVRGVLSARFRDLSRFSLVLKERRLLLSVYGYVRTPGMVDLPAGSNVQVAINAAGGLSPGAQLDRIQIRRGNQVQVFNYKRWLESGERGAMPVLRPLDEIFVPASPLTGNVEVPFDARSLLSSGDAAEDRAAVRVFGEVNQAGTFAWRQGMTVVDAIMRAGGVTRYAGTEQIRIIAGNEPRLFNLKTFLDSGNAGLNAPIEQGTTIFVPVQTEEVKQGPRVAYVMGEVAKPGAYEIRPETQFFDLLANAGGPTRFAETRQLRIIRADGRTVTNFDLGGFVEGSGGRPPRIMPGDAIFVPEKVQGSEQASWLRTPTSRAVRVLGAVRAPGRFEWSDEMSLIDLIAQAGGPTERADMAALQVLPGDAGGRAVTFDLQRFLTEGGRVAALPRIRAGYTITLPEQPVVPNDARATWLRQPADRSIHIMGSVARPGRYAFDEKLSFLDILSAADGPVTSADLGNIRIAHRGEGRDRVTRLNLSRYFETGDDTLLPRIRPGDVIYVPDRNRSWLEIPPEQVVRVLGAVGKPGRYTWHDGMSLLDLLAEAGGPTQFAMQDRIIVVNMSCCASQARAFDLPAFARRGDIGMIPAVRGGDTVYVPSSSQSDWRMFFDNLRDAISVISVLALLKAL